MTLDARDRQGPAGIVAAGHICLDIIPAIGGDRTGHGGQWRLLEPGKLVEIGPAVMATGGAVSNTGIALHRLGMPVKLMGKIGDDFFGQAIRNIVAGHGASLAEGMIVAPGEASSYTIVVSPPGVDRIFLHCTGANDTFTADDVPADSLGGAGLFHFGYPPLMRRMYEDEGAELAKLLQSVKTRGLTVSLDMAKPDPDAPAGKADWRAILARALPHVDVFLPSIEEILFMLRPDAFAELARKHEGDLIAHVDGALLSSLADELIGMGAAVVGLKLGEHGLYVKTTGDAGRLRAMGACSPEGDLLRDWTARELLAPCFEVEVAGTTGAGDCTIAGFLSGLANGFGIEETLRSAVAVGACNVERSDAVSGIRPWEEIRGRMESGWKMRVNVLALPGWNRKENTGIWEAKKG